MQLGNFMKVSFSLSFSAVSATVTTQKVTVEFSWNL